ncbi:MAG: ribonuclease HII [Oligoflexia bacterium]|nr:ribonuclease HII [Oligoflexia bacterium]
MKHFEFEHEGALWTKDVPFVFGVDEAGRGCLAGPVCAAVCVWDPFKDFSQAQVEVDDSKKLSPKKREILFEKIQEEAKLFGIGFASAEEIDEWNILRATYLAIARALEVALKKQPEVLQTESAFLTDGNHYLVQKSKFFVEHPKYKKEFSLVQKLFEKEICEKPLVKGDSRSYSIASASILAKVSRDRLVINLDQQYPDYEFAKHKGYGTKLHLEKIEKFGPSIEHRKTFAPISSMSNRLL